MKKLTLIAIAATMISFGVQGQGLVQFGNSVSATSKISVNATLGGAATGLLPAGVAGSFFFALFYSPTAITVNGNAAAVIPNLAGVGNYVWNDTNWHFAGNGGGTYNVNGNIFTSGGYAANVASAGRVQTLLAGAAPDAVAGLAAGASAHFVVVGWSSNLGTTYGAVQTSLLTGGPASGPWYLGESAVSASFVTGDNDLNAPPTILAGGVVPGFTLGIDVPEPGTMALVGLGGLSLWLFRRRQ